MVTLRIHIQGTFEKDRVLYLELGFHVEKLFDFSYNCFFI